MIAFKGYNIGGFAYCWHDRMEGSYTWFGLTDFKGRPKPSYFALKDLWTNTRSETLPQFTITAPQKVIPGKEYTFTASCSKMNDCEFKFEWYLLKDEFLDKVDNITIGEDAKTVTVQVPEEKSDYRLYLYVSDASGNVTTASTPLRVN